MHRQVNEQTHLLHQSNRNGLSILFAIICIIDVFGVFPIVALPKAITQCGFYGILVVIIVCSIQMYTAVLLGRCWIISEEISPEIREKNRYPYAALMEITYGRKTSIFLTFLLDLTVFGGSIPNLIVASQNLELLGLRLSNNTFDVSFCYWIIVLGSALCPVLWLGSPKDMKCLCASSVAIVYLVFFLTLISMFLSPSTTQIAPQNEEPFWQTILLAYGILSFQFDVHPTILTIQMDMNDKTKLSFAVFVAFLTTLGMFSFITIVAAVKYGQFLLPSVLETLPTTITLHFAAILVALQLCLTSAISNSALYQHMEDCFGISRDFNRKRCILRTILCILSIVLAESVPRFDLVMSLIGGSLTGPLVYIFPPLIYMKIAKLRQFHEDELRLESFNEIVYNKDAEMETLLNYRLKTFQDGFQSDSNNFNGKIEYFLCVLIVVIGCTMTVLTTYVNIINTITYVNFTQPCIYNLSMAILYQ